MIPKNILGEFVTGKLFPQDECFYCFLVNDRNALIKQSIKTAIKICEKQEIPIEERRIRRKKKMANMQKT